MRSRIALICLISLPGFILAGGRVGRTQAAMLTVGGLVRHPLVLSVEDLERFTAATVLVKDTGGGSPCRGAVTFTGVSLKSVLQLAGVHREDAPITKPADLMIIVTGRLGRRMTLSYGEVFYRNPESAIIAYGAVHDGDRRRGDGSCRKCPAPLKCTAAFPRLVLAEDIRAARSVEGISKIEVAAPGPAVAPDRRAVPASREFSISGAVKKNMTVSDISGLLRIDVPGKRAGDGSGFTGCRKYRGAPLARLLESAGIEDDPNTVFLVTGLDGRGSLYSYGELFLSPTGRRIIVADTADGRPLTGGGRFALISPDDLSADRWVTAVNRIEVIRITPRPRLSVIGVGCGDTGLISLRALSRMGSADVFVCSDDIRERFAHYLSGRPVLHDPLLNNEHYYRMKNPNVTEGEVKQRVTELREKNIRSIREAMNSGKTVALLEYGDPTLYGSCNYWLHDHFRGEEIEVVPGISAFNAANAMIARNVADRGSVVITVPDGIRSNEGLVKSVARSGDTLVIFAGLRDFKDLAPLIRKYYPGSTPVTIIYKAGYENSGRLIQSTLADAPAITEGEPEKHLGLIYIGPLMK